VTNRRDFGNREGITEFNVRWHEPAKAQGMFTAVLRVKNEARSLPWVLPGLLRIADALVVVDNGSDDGTSHVAEQVAKQESAEDRLQILDYPFSIARCGAEHLATPPDSVHSLTYFYNWSFSHVKSRYNWKWDGDMVLTIAGEQSFNELKWQLEGLDAIVQIPRYPVYIESDDLAYVDADMRNREAWAWPNGSECYFDKGAEWEIPVWPSGLPFVRLPEWTCFELKWLDADEFQHWTPTEDFSDSTRTTRKAREWAVFHGLREGRTLPGVHRVESPGSKHVIDLLREPAAARYVLTT
jgi:glycosyltransferase involved in cell wall biosynthesis